MTLMDRVGGVCAARRFDITPLTVRPTLISDTFLSTNMNIRIFPQIRPLLAAFGLACLTVSTLAADPLPLESFFRHPDLAEAQLSPSGKRLAVISNLGGRRALLVYELGEQNQRHKVAHFKDVDVSSFNWVGEDRLTFGFVDLKSGNADQRVGGGLTIADYDGKNMRSLIASGLSGLANGGGDPGQHSSRTLSWRHGLAMVPAKSKDEVVVFRYSENAIVPLRLNVNNLTQVGLGDGAPSGVTGWLFDPNGEPRLASVLKDTEIKMYWRAPGSTEWTFLDSHDVLETKWTPVKVDGAGRLYVTEPSGPGSTDVVKLYDFVAKAPAKEALVATPRF